MPKVVKILADNRPVYWGFADRAAEKLGISQTLLAKLIDEGAQLPQPARTRVNPWTGKVRTLPNYTSYQGAWI